MSIRKLVLTTLLLLGLFLISCSRNNNGASSQSSASASEERAIESDNAKSESQKGVSSIQIADIEVITDIAGWDHPAKKVLQNAGLKVNRVELLRGKTYPVFYVTFNQDIYKTSGSYVTQLTNQLAEANAYWDFKIIDSARKIEIEVYCDKTKRIVKGYKYNGNSDYFGDKKAESTEAEVLSKIDRDLVDIILKKRPGVSYRFVNVEFNDVDNDGNQEIFVSSSNAINSSGIKVSVFRVNNEKYEYLGEADTSTGAGWTQLPLKFISLDKSGQKYVWVDVTNGWALGHVLFTVKDSKVKRISSEFPPEGYGTRSFQINSEGFYEKTYYQAYKGTLQGFTVGKLYRWNGEEFKFYKDDIVYESSKGKFVYPTEPMDVIRGYLEAKVMGVNEDAKKYLIDDMVKEIQLDGAVYWENTRNDGLKFSKKTIINDSDFMKVIEIVTGDKPSITFTLVRANSEWKIKQIDTKRLQIETTENIALKGEDFNINYRDVLINDNIPVENITKKLGFGKGHEENNYGLISQYNGIKRWALYYPGRDNTELRLIYLQGSQNYLVSADLLKIPTNRGLKVGDPVDKLISLYGNPNKIQAGIILTYVFGSKYMNVSIDEGRTTIKEIDLYYNMERSMKEQMGDNQ